MYDIPYYQMYNYVRYTLAHILALHEDDDEAVYGLLTSAERAF